MAPLTGHKQFDGLIALLADERDPDKAEALRQKIWAEYGSEGAVLISDMARFSSTSRKLGVCHFLKLIHRARQVIQARVEAHRGMLLKCDADNCYAFFKSADAAIKASYAINAAIFEHNEEFGLAEQVNLSIGIDYGRLLLVAELDYFGDPVNTASKLGEDLAVRAEVLITERAAEQAEFVAPERSERMVARISDIEIQYLRVPMTETLAEP